MCEFQWIGSHSIRRANSGELNGQFLLFIEILKLCQTYLTFINDDFLIRQIALDFDSLLLQLLNWLTRSRVLHVLALVQHQVVLLEECSIALAADVRSNRAFAVGVTLVVQLQPMLSCESFITVLTEMRFRLRLVRLVVVMDNNLRLLSLRLLMLLLLYLVLLYNLNGSDRRVLVLARHCSVDDWLLRHLDLSLRLVLLLEHGWRNALNLLDDLLTVCLCNDLNWNWRTSTGTVGNQGGSIGDVI